MRHTAPRAADGVVVPAQRSKHHSLNLVTCSFEAAQNMEVSSPAFDVVVLAICPNAANALDSLKCWMSVLNHLNIPIILALTKQDEPLPTSQHSSSPSSPPVPFLAYVSSLLSGTSLAAAIPCSARSYRNVKELFLCAEVQALHPLRDLSQQPPQPESAQPTGSLSVAAKRALICMFRQYLPINGPGHWGASEMCRFHETVFGRPLSPFHLDFISKFLSSQRNTNNNNNNNNNNNHHHHRSPKNIGAGGTGRDLRLFVQDFLCLHELQQALGHSDALWRVVQQGGRCGPPRCAADSRAGMWSLSPAYLQLLESKLDIDAGASTVTPRQATESDHPHNNMAQRYVLSADMYTFLTRLFVLAGDRQHASSPQPTEPQHQQETDVASSFDHEEGKENDGHDSGSPRELGREVEELDWLSPSATERLWQPMPCTVPACLLPQAALPERYSESPERSNEHDHDRCQPEQLLVPSLSLSLGQLAGASRATPGVSLDAWLKYWSAFSCFDPLGCLCALSLLGFHAEHTLCVSRPLVARPTSLPVRWPGGARANNTSPPVVVHILIRGDPAQCAWLAHLLTVVARDNIGESHEQDVTVAEGETATALHTDLLLLPLISHAQSQQLAQPAAAGLLLIQFGPSDSALFPGSCPHFLPASHKARRACPDLVLTLTDLPDQNAASPCAPRELLLRLETLDTRQQQGIERLQEAMLQLQKANSVKPGDGNAGKAVSVPLPTAAALLAEVKKPRGKGEARSVEAMHRLTEALFQLALLPCTTPRTAPLLQRNVLLRRVAAGSIIALGIVMLLKGRSLQSFLSTS
eukprot:g4286.t1